MTTPGLPAALPPGLMRFHAGVQRGETSPIMAELKVRSEIAGSVWKIEVAVGDAVGEEDPLITLESMKMEIPLLSPRAGIVREILVAEGDPIGEGDIALILE
jgi:acetyl-CoA carboxylase biotin carboxyl carrier protein